MFKYAVLSWVSMLLLAILVAVFRESVIKFVLGDRVGHIIGTIIFLMIQTLVIYFFVDKTHAAGSNGIYIIVGICWLYATVLFEFIFGHYVMGHSWVKLFYDYNILAGRLWSLVLLNSLLGSLIIYNLRFRSR